MTADIKLDGQDVTLESVNSYFRRQGSSSVSINLANSTGHWHISGPRDEDDGPLAIYWFNASTQQYEGPKFRLGRTHGLSHLDVARRQEFVPILTGRPASVIIGAKPVTTVNLLDLLAKMSETISSLQTRIAKLEHPGPGINVVGSDPHSNGRPQPIK